MSPKPSQVATSRAKEVEIVASPKVTAIAISSPAIRTRLMATLIG